MKYICLSFFIPALRRHVFSSLIKALQLHEASCPGWFDHTEKVSTSLISCTFQLGKALPNFSCNRSFIMPYHVLTCIIVPCFPASFSTNENRNHIQALSREGTSYNLKTIIEIETLLKTFVRPKL